MRNHCHTYWSSACFHTLAALVRGLVVLRLIASSAASGATQPHYRAISTSSHQQCRRRESGMQGIIRVPLMHRILTKLPLSTFHFLLRVFTYYIIILLLCSIPGPSHPEQSVSQSLHASKPGMIGTNAYLLASRSATHSPLQLPSPGNVSCGRCIACLYYSLYDCPNESRGALRRGALVAPLPPKDDGARLGALDVVPEHLQRQPPLRRHGRHHVLGPHGRQGTQRRAHSTRSRP